MSKYKILIIEDQQDVRKLFRFTLDFEEYELHEAPDADLGHKIIQDIKPDLIVLDVMMPGDMDGYGLCDNLKSSPEYESIPVIMLTARGQPSDREAGLRAGADVYMVKPFSPIKLVDVVDHLLKSAKAAASEA